jgi:hypothetical protein
MAAIPTVKEHSSYNGKTFVTVRNSKLDPRVVIQLVKNSAFMEPEVFIFMFIK